MSGRPLTLPCPGSKSITQRALLIAALSTPRQKKDGAPVLLRGALDCDDSHHLSRLLRALGAEVEWDRDTVRVTPLGQPRPLGVPLSLGNAGTAVRFGSCLAALVEGELIIDGDVRMRQRPLAPLLRALETLGVAVEERGADGCPPVCLVGPARSQGATTVRLDASLSSQYASGLLLVAPRLAAPLTLLLEGARVSRPYLEMTVTMLERAGADVRWCDDTTLQARPSRYALDTLTVEADWSAAAFLLGAGWLRGVEVAIDNLPPLPRSLQGDAVFAEQLIELGRPGARRFDLTDAPDLIAPLAALALFAEGPTTICGAAHARVKECDRVAVLARELSRLGAEVQEHGDGLEITPLPAALRDAPAEGLTLRAEDDHRMAMAFGLCALRRRGLAVDNPACVSKSFPDFWSVWEQLA
jgi:3-phosphoshikimate 1-carboxyvinyltransferase